MQKEKMKEIKIMNTNTMELNLKEMETVNGGSLIESLKRIKDATVIYFVREFKDCNEPIGLTVGSLCCLGKGIIHEITR